MQAMEVVYWAGLQGFTRTLAIEPGRFGVTADAIAPGFIETEMTRATAQRVGVPFRELWPPRPRRSPYGGSDSPRTSLPWCPFSQARARASCRDG
jgi:NAD(P)-dependent dehydrogenase (short-subunit alcohol dehydrogenase family)